MLNILFKLKQSTRS